MTGTSLASLLSIRRDRASIGLQNSLASTTLNLETSPTSAVPAVIQSAKLLSHIVSENSQPFHRANTNQNAARNIAPNPFTLPNIENNRQQSPDYNDGDYVLLELLQPTRTQTGSSQNDFISHPVTSQQTFHNVPTTQVSNTNQLQNHNRENFLVTIPDGNDSQFQTSAPNVFQNEQRIVINDQRNQGQNVNVPKPSLVTTRSDTNFNNANNQFSILPPVQTIQTPSITTFDFNKIGVPLIPLPPQQNDINNNNALTVGDLVMSLDGRNGIRVISLGDLTNGVSSSLRSSSNADADLLQQIRNAMISGNINSFSTLQSSDSDALSGDSPSLASVQQNIDALSKQPNEDEAKLGRQFEFGFNSNIQNNAQDEVGVINDLLFDATITAQGSTSGSSVIDDLFSPSDSGTAAISSNADTVQDIAFDTITNADDTPLEDNTDFDFGSFDDDLPPLPPQPPNVFRRGLSDIFFTKGQWIGTILGGMFDVGSAVGSSVSKIFNKTPTTST